MFSSLSTESQFANLHPSSGVLVRYALVGVGGVAEIHHVPGIDIDPRASLVAVCDADQSLLEKREKEWGPGLFATTKWEEIVTHPDVDAVIVATPNMNHYAIVEGCIKNGKHVMCEKPIGLNAKEALALSKLANSSESKGLVNMTAFTYRFSPAIRYLKQLIDEGKLGTIRHFRSQRFLDWDETSWGWRQYKATAGAGNIYDMMIHRIDFAHYLIGKITSVSGKIKQFVPRDKTTQGKDCPKSEVDDWTAIMCEFENGATGVFEGSTLMKGHHNNGFGFEWLEVNGSLGSAVYQLSKPHILLFGTHGESLKELDVPKELLVISGSPRDPTVGEPSKSFRFDQLYEFSSAIVEKRPSLASLQDGAAAQIVADACIQSSEQKKWIDIAYDHFDAGDSSSLIGQCAIVTGGGSGIGKAVALGFAQSGARVYILGRRTETLQEVVKEFESKGLSTGKIIALSCDVSDSSAVERTFQSVFQSEKSVSILVNSAGMNIKERKIDELSPENWNNVMNANVNGAFYCIHAILPHMRQHSGGLIVNVSSIASLRGLPLAGTAYCASKAAMSMMGSTVSAEQFQHGIRVCNFCPGEVNTPIIDQRAVVPSAEDRAMMLQPQDCAAAILMVALLPARAQVSELIIKPTVQQFWI